MQVQETLADGLKREFQVVVPLNELGAKVEQRLTELKDRVKINGFRPGKVPMAHLKRMYGRSVMAETIDAAVQEANSQIVSERGLRVAMEPKITLPTEESEVTALIEGKADLTYKVALEILPQVELGDMRSITIERPVAPVTDEEMNEAVSRLAQGNRPFADKGEGAKAENGDRVVMSFAGTIDGKPFEGGSGTDVNVDLGSGTFIPGFEEQLLGAAAGETRSVHLPFPKNYLNAELAGRDAVFEVQVTAVQAPGNLDINDEWAKSLGMESLEKLRDAMRERLGREHAAASRRRVKRVLLDAIDERHQFELPPSLVEEEFTNVWRTVTADLESAGRTFADEGTSEEQAREEYRRLAERRVRLGLVLAEIGEKNAIKVTDEEVSRAVMERARQFPGQERQVWEYYQKNPQMLASLRAPIFEEKVVDYLLELANMTDREVSREELFQDDAEDPDAGPQGGGAENPAN